MKKPVETMKKQWNPKKIKVDSEKPVETVKNQWSTKKISHPSDFVGGILIFSGRNLLFC